MNEIGFYGFLHAGNPTLLERFRGFDPLQVGTVLPLLDLNDPAAIAQWLLSPGDCFACDPGNNT